MEGKGWMEENWWMGGDGLVWIDSDYIDEWEEMDEWEKINKWKRNG